MDGDREQIIGIMLDLLSQNADMQTIINEATDILGNPMVLIDTRFRILYTSTNVEVNNDLWKQTLVEQYVSDEIISSMEKSCIISRLQAEEKPIEYDIPDGYKAIRMPLFYKKRYCGFIGVYDYLKPMNLDDSQCLRIISKAITAMLYADSSLIGSTDNRYEDYLHELVKCGRLEQAEAICRKNSSMSLGKRKILICVNRRGDEEEQKNMPCGRIRDIMNQYLYQHCSTIYENRLVMLFCLDRMSGGLWDNTLASVEKYCSQYDLMAGTSFEFIRTEYMPYAYRQAVFAAERPDDTRVRMFESHMLDSIMDQCLENYSAGYYEHPAIRKIKEYDQEFKTDYLNTLRAYLDSFCNLKETAASLDIHYNTMKYRMSMVEKMIDRPLKGNNLLKMQLYFSIHIRDYADTY